MFRTLPETSGPRRDGAGQRSTHTPRRDRAGRVLTGLVLGWALACAAPALAQPQGPPQWWALDSAPAGTPPTIQLDPSASSTQQTVLDITIHGFYYQTILAQGQQFRRLAFDQKVREADYVQYRTVGRPELPALHHTVALLCGTTVGTPQYQVIEEVQIPNALIYPAQIQTGDDDPPPPFQWDQAFYQQTTSTYPNARGQSLGPQGMMARMRIGNVEAYPMRYVPATRTLNVTKRLRLTIPHQGTLPPNRAKITRREAARIEYTIDNWPVVEDYRDVILNGMAGDYLIVTDPSFTDEIEPLADQKRWRNYEVTVATTDETGGTANQIRNYIIDWYNSGDRDRDHYVLLVGDTADIPMCTDEYGNPSDKMYACVEGTDPDGTPDVYPEIMLGRFSCDSGTECADMVEKTLDYEDGFGFGSDWLDDVLLVAHKQGDNKWYQEAHEVVETADYVVQPVFHTAYGREGATNADVRDEIEAGRGVVAYRGHGDEDAWTSWNNANQYFDRDEVALLDNNEKTPVVFSFACTNNDLLTDDCFGEKWMETRERAVAFHGASVPSGTAANHTYDREVFDAIYNYDTFLIISEATAAAEVVVNEAFLDDPWSGQYNSWVYLLLGDPELKIWREDVPELVLSDYPQDVPTGGGVFRLRVSDGQLRSPVPFATVAVYKDGEVADNRYSDADGWVEIPIDPETPGQMRVTVFTEFGDYGVSEALVNVLDMPAGASDPTGLPASLQLARVQPNPVSQSAVLRYALPRPGAVDLSIFDVHGRRVAALVENAQPSGWHSVVWNGRDAAGRAVSGGVYFSRLSFEGQTRTTRLQVVR
jgi:hypothetical protein